MKLLPRARAFADQATLLAIEQIERLLAGLERFTSSKDGLVPASRGGTTNFLRADGTWANPVGTGAGVASVTAGSSKVTASPTTGAVVVDVVPANFTGIPETAITNLVSDLGTRPTGSGTVNKVPKWTGTSVLGNSGITDIGTVVNVQASTDNPLALYNAAGTNAMGAWIGTHFVHNFTSWVLGNAFTATYNLEGDSSGNLYALHDFVVDGNARLNNVSGTTEVVGATQFDATVTNKQNTAFAVRQVFTGTDNIGNTDNTNGPAWELSVNLPGRREVMLVDSAASGSGNLAWSLGVGTALGLYIQGVNTNYTLGQTIQVNPLGGQIHLGRGTDTVTCDGPTTITGLIDATGQSIYLGRQVLTASSGPYTPTTGCRKVLLRMIGAGGGGGGASGNGLGSTCAGAAGGAGGAFIEKWINPAATITGGAYTTGAAGTAGATTPTNGGTGGDSTVVIQGVTYTAKGGTGGTAMAFGSTLAYVAPGTTQAGSTTGDDNSQQSGAPGVRLAALTAWGGNGGSSPLGGGGVGGTGSGNVSGANGNGYGAGGGGGESTSTGAAGGTGSPGVIIIDEWR